MMAVAIMANIANSISIARCLLGFGIIALIQLNTTNTHCYYWAFALTIVCIWMDGLDGFIARKCNESSKLGSVIDILSDRIVEMTYWIAFAAWSWVPLWAQIVVMSRGIIVDGIRGFALAEGLTAFGEQSMMKHPLGILLVSSRFSRWTYAVTKAILFSTAFLIFQPQQPFIHYQPIFMVLVYITTVFCLLRGLPVILEARRLLKVF